MSFYANGPAMLGMSITLSILSILAVAGRFSIRKRYNQELGMDDWLMLPALLLTIGLAITIIFGVENRAVGYTIKSSKPGAADQRLVVAQQVHFAVFLINIPGLMFAKLSIVFFYRRIFVTGTNKLISYITIAMIFLIVSWGVAYFFVTLFGCGPNIAMNWSTYKEEATTCLPANGRSLSYVATDLLVDLALFILPIPLILRLRMSTARRLAVLLIFSIGALTLVTSSIRVAFFGYIYAGMTSTLLSTDPILNISIFLYWTMLEGGLSIIVGCLPTFQIWFKSVTIDTVVKRMRGMFSIQSFSRSSRVSTQQKSLEAALSKGSLPHESFEIVYLKRCAIDV